MNSIEYRWHSFFLTFRPRVALRYASVNPRLFQLHPVGVPVRHWVVTCFSIGEDGFHWVGCWVSFGEFGFHDPVWRKIPGLGYSVIPI